MEPWIGEVVGTMHVHRISQGELANRIGFRRDYLSKILNGTLMPKGAREKIVSALQSIVDERQQSA